MATYQELRNLFSNSDLTERCESAVIIAANTLSSGTPTNAQKAWSAQAYANTTAEAQKVLKGVLAKNASATVAQILGASDSVLQNNVDDIAQLLADVQALNTGGGQ